MRQSGTAGAPITGAEGARPFQECIVTKISEEDMGTDFEKGNGWQAFFLQNVPTSHPSHWIRIIGLTFRDCIVAEYADCTGYTAETDHATCCSCWWLDPR
jgi:hypothetical protein